jgi:hypothetical protein
METVPAIEHKAYAGIREVTNALDSKLLCSGRRICAIIVGPDMVGRSQRRRLLMLVLSRIVFGSDPAKITFVRAGWHHSPEKAVVFGICKLAATAC